MNSIRAFVFIYIIRIAPLVYTSLRWHLKFFLNLFNSVFSYSLPIAYFQQMIESSAHGDEYDGVMYSQLVWYEISLDGKFHLLLLMIIIILVPHPSCFPESDWSSGLWKFQNWDNGTEEKGRIVYKQKSFNSRNCRC